MTPSGEEELERLIDAEAAGPPPLRPFGLVLHHDGHFTHEGQPILNARLRAHFDRSVAYLPEEEKYVVRLGHFRGEVEVEEAGFFVREVDVASGRIRLSDGSEEALDLDGLALSPIDGALLCVVKRDLVECGLPARFSQSAQAELLAAVESGEGSTEYSIVLGGRRRPFPAL